MFIPTLYPYIVGTSFSILLLLSPIVNVPLFNIAVPFKLSIFPVFSVDVSINCSVALFVHNGVSKLELPILYPFKSNIIFCPSYVVNSSSVLLIIVIVVCVSSASLLHVSIASCIVKYLVSPIWATGSWNFTLYLICVSFALFPALSVTFKYKLYCPMPNFVLLIVVSFVKSTYVISSPSKPHAYCIWSNPLTPVSVVVIVNVISTVPFSSVTV